MIIKISYLAAANEGGWAQVVHKLVTSLLTVKQRKNIRAITFISVFPCHAFTIS